VGYKETIRELKENLSDLRIIHYSCQNLSDYNENYSPRITSIAVLHVERSTMHSFSIHLVAEEEKVERENIESEYDRLEREMLDRFYQFVTENPNTRWLHWNMTNINYGFETLSHRYRVLTGKDAPKIADSRRYNLSALVLEKYGKDCVDHPRMAKLMELNGGKPRDSLTGQEEVEAFQAKEFIRLHKSTMSKAYWFQSMFQKVLDNKVATQRSNWKGRVNHIVESTPAKVLGLIAVLYTIGQLAYVGYQHLPSWIPDLLNSEARAE